ncbi:MAG: GntG family PLP-dependent aldolase [Candidatus Hydrogenedentota bacterium]
MSISEIIDLRSDTVTQPTAAMREAMASAVVGDDVFGEDPTVNALQDRCATLFGKEAALFVPSGTMANLLGLLAQSSPGETVVIHESGHAYNFEGGNLAAFGGLMTRLLPGASGKLSPEVVKTYLSKSDNPHFSQPAIVSIENTTNMGGGNTYSVEEFSSLYDLTRGAGVALHCDGARIMNACVAEEVDPDAYGCYTDTITCCFSKGLGAPVGSILAGTKDTIARAYRHRKMLGGGMRQAGILAAAALYALENHVHRLAEDHANARRFREALLGVPNIHFPEETATNIVFFEVPDAQGVVAQAQEEGLRILTTGPVRIRAVFHLDISDADTDRAVETLLEILS